ncbi:nuclear receptor coactivator 7 isoform X1 [Tympanuchus pallidicinctus]|uniref:nuclear receptor coactivator 7 isoform X1 n=1 Tax=Tympanuchus pallidicinctus TaxID=109042 RepID=UPI0022872462|nr:nuclear receptor coactivator 7 isoform X1 [Tympanuchus pallidicinctus]XP_052533353.1 nuclear receptor coactivator 7 isoform X1 [Tympanuchus pallidicinctus]XP_052533360.1 nuclear receptor coactivator 7 isoform X1 [Tympanuchus pallidicinctus]XP_052533368.1 nuclear receptor coactivator 7 isoform X1 [Tympanuchus pallidicinctus]XP_052533375.1 nuclear receptor coactivator 7 isoform X1 [Tympanuchus pallidicinctus]
METKEEKKERRQGYFARLKKKRQAKQNTETISANSPGSPVSKIPAEKDDESKVILEQISSSEDKCKFAGEKEAVPDKEKRKKKYNQLKDIRRTELKRYYSTDDNQNKTNEKKEKKMVSQKPHGTIEYIAGNQDTINSIALKFNITPNKLVELNKLFTHTIVPGQILFVPETSVSRLPSFSPGAPISPSSSDAEYDKLPDADLARKAFKPVERVLSSTSEEDEPVVVKFLKMNCRYFTDGKGVVGGVMIVTPNNIMFDPHKSDPLVIENGCEEYGLICPMEEVVSIALYNDISHMKIKDALPSDIPKDLCPLYRPGEWEDLSSEKDINPFSKFKSLSKEKRQQNGDSPNVPGAKQINPSDKEKSADFEVLQSSESTGSIKSKSLESYNNITATEHLEKFAADPHVKELSEEKNVTDIRTKEDSFSGGRGDDFIDLEKVPSPVDRGLDRKISLMEGLLADPRELGRTKQQVTKPTTEVQEHFTVDSLEKKDSVEPKADLDLELCEKQDVIPEVNKCVSSPTGKVETALDTKKELEKDKLIEFYLNKDGSGSQSSEDLHKAEIQKGENNKAIGIDLTLSCSKSQADEVHTVKSMELDSCCVGRKAPSLEGSAAAAEEKDLKESLDSSLVPAVDKTCQETQLDNQSEVRLWLLQKIQVPIEDMLPSKEEKSKTPPMFLCIKVGKPMRKSFVSQSTSVSQQYSKKIKQPEYWFAVPRERVDHLYTFFVQWSPEIYGKDAKEQGFVVVEKEELDMIDNFFSEPTTKSWEIITVEEAKRRKSVCSYYGEEDDDDALPVLKHHSALLENMHIEQLARRLPARVQGYPWQLAYSTLEHGTSLKTLYRKSASLDSPVLLVIKDMDNEIFGAYATHPFRFSDHYYGTGETFLYTFSPNFKVFKWSGENTYFINGDMTSLELGGGGGRFGLWLDADLYHGRSNSCSTFNNDILSKKEDFIIQDVEVWTFE